MDGIDGIRGKSRDPWWACPVPCLGGLVIPCGGLVIPCGGLVLFLVLILFLVIFLRIPCGGLVLFLVLVIFFVFLVVVSYPLWWSPISCHIPCGLVIFLVLFLLRMLSTRL